MPRSFLQLKPGKVFLCTEGMIGPVWWYSPGELNSVKRAIEPVVLAHLLPPILHPSICLFLHLSIYPSLILASIFPSSFPLWIPLYPLFTPIATPSHPFPSFSPAPLPRQTSLPLLYPLPIFHLCIHLSTPFPQKSYVLRLLCLKVI